jgi:hypothetical protein
MENTAAASVEETIAPMSIPSFQEIFKMYAENVPKETAVINTPMVAMEIPVFKTGLILSIFVSRPPEKRMKASATAPRNWAILGSLK